MAKTKHDPQRIFRIAEWFNLAGNTLMQQVNAMRGVAIPSSVLSAFSLELYLKCLIAIETQDKPPTGHKLSWLFSRLSDQTRDRIRDSFDHPLDPEEVRLRAMRKNVPADVPVEMAKMISGEDDFDTVLKKSEDAFTKLRYAYEGKGGAWGAGDIVKAVRGVILDMHPEWDKPEANY